jgi:hypothetical protein
VARSAFILPDKDDCEVVGGSPVGEDAQGASLYAMGHGQKGASVDRGEYVAGKFRGQVFMLLGRVWYKPMGLAMLRCVQSKNLMRFGDTGRQGFLCFGKEV